MSHEGAGLGLLSFLVPHRCTGAQHLHRARFYIPFIPSVLNIFVEKHVSNLGELQFYRKVY